MLDRSLHQFIFQPTESSSLVRVLIVDEDYKTRNELKDLLISCHVKVEIVGESENAQNALEIIVGRVPDLVFMDMQSSEKCGRWLSDKIQKLHAPVRLVFLKPKEKIISRYAQKLAFAMIQLPIQKVGLENLLQSFADEKVRYSSSRPNEEFRLGLSRQKLKLITHQGFKMIAPFSIVYAISFQNETRIFLSNGRVLDIAMDIQQLSKTLLEPDFIAVSDTAIINTDYIEEFNKVTKIVVLMDVLQKYEVRISDLGCQKLAEMSFS